MNEKWKQALGEISDKHIADAATYRKRPRLRWLAPVAAVLALAILIGVLQPSNAQLPVPPDTQPSAQATEPYTPVVLTNLVVSREYPKMAACPNYTDDVSFDDYDAAYDAWCAAQKEQYDQPEGYADTLTDFFARSIPEFLSGDGNQACSPLNVYMALAMLAETTGGNSRQQLLELLGSDSITELRTQAGHVWNAHYSDDGLTATVLANSLWLDEAYAFHKDTAALLADSYYASVFHGDLGTEELNRQLRTWLNQQTGGLLEEQAKNTKLSPDTVFALASTVWFRADWNTKFQERNTKESLFHSSNGDISAQFMNATLSGTYYWGEHFGAVNLELSGSNRMWLILPDEGFSVSDILESDAYLRLTLGPAQWENQKRCTINLSLPKFDVSSQKDLVSSIRDLGVSDIFDYGISDFTSITDSAGLFVDKIDHAVRVTIDEDGCTAAAYTVISEPTGSMPPTDEIDFILDRPFVFLVSSRDDLPLFAGVVNEPSRGK